MRFVNNHSISGVNLDVASSESFSKTLRKVKHPF